MEDGDVILLATDGIFDNVPTSLLVDQISSNMDAKDDESPLTSSPLAKDLEEDADARFARSCEEAAVRLQQCANSIALIARKLSQDPNFLSPFAKNARNAGIANVRGGKEDDITVLLATIKVQKMEEAGFRQDKDESSSGNRAQA